MSNVSNAKILIQRYENEKINLKKVLQNYQDAIDELNKIDGVDECTLLQKDIMNKKTELEKKVIEIGNVQKSLLKKAMIADQEAILK